MVATNTVVFFARMDIVSWRQAGGCGNKGSSGDVVMRVADNKDKQGELTVVSVARAVS